jgi:hypothetical protein
LYGHLQVGALQAANSSLSLRAAEAIKMAETSTAQAEASQRWGVERLINIAADIGRFERFEPI